MRNRFRTILVFPILLSGCSLVRKAHNAIFPADTVRAVIEQTPQMAILTRCWWLVPGSVLGVAGAVFLAVQGRLKLALSLGAAAGATLWLSVSVFSHFALMGYIGLAVPILILGYAGWQAYIKARAVPELVETVEKAKERMDIVDSVELFGGDDDHGLAGTIQSKATEKLVAEVRKAIK